MLDISQKILEISDKKEEKFLREKTKPFDFKKFSREEIRNLIKKMRKIMQAANGIGLSANQIGLPYRIFVAQVPDSNGHFKFYAVFNPEITKISNEKDELEEGCLSVPQTFGTVERAYKIILSGQDISGKNLKIKAWDLLARVFQHEVDHLNGILFIDKAKSLYNIGNLEQENQYKI